MRRIVNGAPHAKLKLARQRCMYFTHENYVKLLSTRTPQYKSSFKWRTCIAERVLWFSFPEFHGRARILSLVHSGGARASPRARLGHAFHILSIFVLPYVSELICVFLVLILFRFRVLVCTCDKPCNASRSLRCIYAYVVYFGG